MLPFAPKFLGQVRLAGESLGIIEPPSSFEIATAIIHQFETAKSSAENFPDVPEIQDALSYTDSMGESYPALQYILSSKQPNSPWTQAEDDELSKFTDAANAFGSKVDGAILSMTSEIGKTIHDLRAEDAAQMEIYGSLKAAAVKARARQAEDPSYRAAGFYENGTISVLADVKRLDEQIYQNVKKAESMIPMLSKGKQAEGRQLLREYGVQTAALKGRLSGSSVAMLGQAAGVECLPTKEGGKVCTDGTYYPPGGGTPVNASEAPSSGVSTKTLVIGGLTLAAIAGGAVYFFTR